VRFAEFAHGFVVHGGDGVAGLSLQDVSVDIGTLTLRVHVKRVVTVQTRHAEMDPLKIDNTMIKLTSDVM
jgi:hypothetical protein